MAVKELFVLSDVNCELALGNVSETTVLPSLYCHIWLDVNFCLNKLMLIASSIALFVQLALSHVVLLGLRTAIRKSYETSMDILKLQNRILNR